MKWEKKMEPKDALGTQIIFSVDSYRNNKCEQESDKQQIIAENKQYFVVAWNFYTPTYERKNECIHTRKKRRPVKNKKKTKTKTKKSWNGLNEQIE